MYKVLSSHFGWLTSKDNIEDAISRAKHFKNCKPEAVISIWKDGEKIMTIE